VTLAGAAQAPFSHQEALAGTKGACQPCHAAMLKSEAIPERESRPVKRVKFSHALHLKLGNVDPVIGEAVAKGLYLSQHPHTRDVNPNQCQGCHRGLASAETALTKANYPHMADCLVCHNKIDVPFSCEQCHSEPPAKLQPANHTAGFIDRHTAKDSGLDKSECASCHGKKFTCLGCH
jgi:hypothetical protein